jgi:hypothetical protein
LFVKGSNNFSGNIIFIHIKILGMSNVRICILDAENPFEIQ